MMVNEVSNTILLVLFLLEKQNEKNDWIEYLMLKSDGVPTLH